MSMELADPAAWAAGEGTAGFNLLGAFLLGYLAILATPGPNLLAVASIATLHGLRGAMPICLGIAAGAGALGITMLLAAETVVGAAPGGETVGRVAAALLLLVTAVFVLCLPPAPYRTGGGAAPPGRLGVTAGHSAAFGSGFCTAMVNPLTGAFFAAQFLGPLGAKATGATALLVLLGIVATALVVMLGAATLLSRPAVRRAALAWHRLIRITAAAALLTTGAATLWPAISP